MATKSQVTTLDDDTPESAGAAATVVTGSNHDATLSGKNQTITIHPTDGDGGSDAVFVSVNGYAYQIPRGLPYQVPVEVIEVLRNAKQSILSFGQGGTLMERTTQRFAYSTN